MEINKEEDNKQKEQELTTYPKKRKFFNYKYYNSKKRGQKNKKSRTRKKKRVDINQQSSNDPTNSPETVNNQSVADFNEDKNKYPVGLPLEDISISSSKERKKNKTETFQSSIGNELEEEVITYLYLLITSKLSTIL